MVGRRNCITLLKILYVKAAYGINHSQFEQSFKLLYFAGLISLVNLFLVFLINYYNIFDGKKS